MNFPLLSSDYTHARQQGKLGLVSSFYPAAPSLHDECPWGRNAPNRIASDRKKFEKECAKPSMLPPTLWPLILKLVFQSSGADASVTQAQGVVQNIIVYRPPSVEARLLTETFVSETDEGDNHICKAGKAAPVVPVLPIAPSTVVGTKRPAFVPPASPQLNVAVHQAPAEAKTVDEKPRTQGLIATPQPVRVVNQVPPKLPVVVPRPEDGPIVAAPKPIVDARPILLAAKPIVNKPAQPPGPQSKDHPAKAPPELEASHEPSAPMRDPLAVKFTVDALATHNRFRAQHGAAPLTWNSTLETFAQTWSSKCRFEHSAGEYGENLAEGYTDVKEAVAAWYDECKTFDWADGGFDDEHGHCTQMLWSDTTQVGCHLSHCPNLVGGDLLFCNYWPAGNIVTGDLEHQTKGDRAFFRAKVPRPMHFPKHLHRRHGRHGRHEHKDRR